MTAAYTVRTGDTLGHIARKHGASVTRLMNLNPGIEHPDRIYAGQVLKVPANDEDEFSSAPAMTLCDPAPCQDDYVEIIHVTGSDTLYFLTEEDLDEIIEEELLVGAGIDQLYCAIENGDALVANGADQPQASEGVLRSELQQKKQALLTDLEDLRIVGTSMQGTPKLTEIKRLRGNRHYTYVRSDKIANHWRSYRMTARDHDRSKGWLSREGIDRDRFRQAVEADFGFKLKTSFWKLDPESNFSKSINQFHKEVSWSVWGDKQQEKTQLDETGFNASAEAQFMRFASGAGASAEFTPSKGKVHLQARADAQFSLAQGKATIEQAYPANNESEIRIYYRKGGWDGPRTYETMGHFQTRLTITASGYAGASALLAANVKVDCSEGVPSIKGIASKPGDDEGVHGQAGAFAGVRAGCELLGGLYWVDKLTRQQDWKTLCSIGEKVEGAAGIGAEAYLKLGFSRNTGKFFLRAHAGLVFGLGASGTFVFEVNTNDLASLMRFVYNGLLKADIRYLELFDNETNAFAQYVRFSLLALSKGLDYGDAATEIISSGIVNVERYITSYLHLHKERLSREDQSEVLAQNILKDIVKGEDSVFLHSPPEVKGPLLNKLTYDYSLTLSWFEDNSAKVEAITMILKSFQGWRDFEESMLRMNPDGTAQPGTVEANALKLFRFIDKDEQDYRLFKHFLENQAAISSRPVILDPFKACQYCGIT